MKKIILVCFLISTSIYSQTGEPTEQSSSKIKVYSPSASSTKSSDNSYKWTVKTDIFSIVSGEFPLIGEFRFAKKISAEISAGATYGLYDNFGILSDGYEGEGSTFESKAGIGTSFRAGVKFYPSSDYDAIEGWAFGVQIFSRTNNRDYTEASNYSKQDVTGEKDSRNKTGIALTISKQIFEDSNISYEFLLGVGFANAKHEFITSNDMIDPNDKNKTVYYLKRNTINETIPNIQLGLRIGFGN